MIFLGLLCLYPFWSRVCVCVCVCVCACVCVLGGISSHHQGVLWHQQGVLQFNSSMTLPGHSVRPQRLRALSHNTAAPSPAHFRPQSQSQVAPCSSDQLYRWRFQWPPSLNLIHLLEQLPESTETFYLLDYWFIIKRTSKDTNQQPDEEMHRVRYEERAQSFHALSRCHFPHIFTCSLA